MLAGSRPRRTSGPGWALLATLSTLTLAVPARAALIAPDPPAPRPYLLGEILRPADRRVLLVVSGQAEGLIPGGQLFDHAHTTVLYGGGVGAEARLSAMHALRLGLGITRAKLTAREADRGGSITVTPVNLRLDYVFGASWLQPYLGVGLGIVPWHGLVKQTSTGLANESEGTPVSLNGAIGVDVGIAGGLSIAPEASFTRVGGGFHESFWRAGLVLRWKD